MWANCVNALKAMPDLKDLTLDIEWTFNPKPRYPLVALLVDLVVTLRHKELRVRIKDKELNTKSARTLKVMSAEGLAGEGESGMEHTSVEKDDGSMTEGGKYEDRGTVRTVDMR